MPRPDVAQRLTDDLAANTALLAQTGQTTGTPPTDGELIRWARGELSGKRLAEVDSHIAHDPAVFDAAMARTDAEPAEPTRSQWPGAFALAATLVVGLAFGATMLRTPESTTGAVEDVVVRSATTAATDWRAAAFAAGLAGGDVTTLSAAPAQCLDADCASLAPLLYRYGARLSELQSACPANASSLDDLRRALAGSFELAPYANALDAIARRAGPVLRCNDIAALIANPTG